MSLITKKKLKIENFKDRDTFFYLNASKKLNAKQVAITLYLNLGKVLNEDFLKEYGSEIENQFEEYRAYGNFNTIEEIERQIKATIHSYIYPYDSHSAKYVISPVYFKIYVNVNVINLRVLNEALEKAKQDILEHVVDFRKFNKKFKISFRKCLN